MNPDNKSQVNHIDGNKVNNNVNNLEWVTSKENINHFYKTKSISISRIGSKNGRAKLTQEKVNEIRLKLVNGARIIDLSKEYLIASSTVSCIKSNRTWSIKV